MLNTKLLLTKGGNTFRKVLPQGASNVTKILALAECTYLLYIPTNH